MLAKRYYIIRNVHCFLFRERSSAQFCLTVLTDPFVSCIIWVLKRVEALNLIIGHAIKLDMNCVLSLSPCPWTAPLIYRLCVFQRGCTPPSTPTPGIQELTAVVDAYEDTLVRKHLKGSSLNTCHQMKGRVSSRREILPVRNTSDKTGFKVKLSLFF